MSARSTKVGSVAKQDFVFVNNIRHWAMFAIIFIHCASSASAFGSSIPTPMYLCIELAKFGTIAFFLASGFLLGSRFEENGRVDYLRRRMSRLMVPWFAWLGIYWAMRPLAPFLFPREYPLRQSPWNLLWSFHDTLTGSAYWFVPSIVIALSVLLLCTRYIEDWRFGAATFVISLFYGVNVHCMWIPTSHTTALLGFLSYLWLGAWASRHWERVQTFVNAMPVTALLPIGVIFLAASTLETRQLLKAGSLDAFNTLRISNQAYSIVVVLLMLKTSRKLVWPRFVDVRAHTFGLYLTHSPVIMVSLVLMRQVFLLQDQRPSSPAAVSAALLMLFAISYTASLSITKLLAGSPLFSWIVGSDAPAIVKKQSIVPSMSLLR